jgi:hypothetical protein
LLIFTLLENAENPGNETVAASAAIDSKELRKSAPTEIVLAFKKSLRFRSDK